MIFFVRGQHLILRIIFQEKGNLGYIYCRIANRVMFYYNKADERIDFYEFNFVSLFSL